MQTRILEPSKENIKLCADVIKKSGVVAFPTETVYGLAADACCESAIKKIFEIKGRPSDNPLIMHVSNRKQIYAAAESVPAAAERLMDRFMPGALTIVLKKRAEVPYALTGGLDTVGVRMPSHRVALAFIEACGRPLCAPSANTSTRPSPTTAMHVYDDLSGKLQYILDGGKCSVGLESTIVDYSSEKPVLLRKGGLDIPAIEAITGKLIIADIQDKALAPGMKYKHYSPDANVYVYAYSDSMTQKIIGKYKMLKTSGKTAIMCYNRHVPCYRESLGEDCPDIYEIGENNADYAFNIYDFFRRLEKSGYKNILCEGPESGGIGSAVLNRLIKAGGGLLL